jgi:ribosomal protein L37E
MAKTKAAVPTKTCPQCGKGVHVATRTCPECGTAFPMKRRKKKAGAKKRKAAAAPAPSGSSLVAAAALVREAGGMDGAQQALKELEKVKKALG